jgi:hypothetical protein
LTLIISYKHNINYIIIWGSIHSSIRWGPHYYSHSWSHMNVDK